MGRRARGTGSIVAVGGGRWKARKLDPSTHKYQAATFDSKKAADEWLRIEEKPKTKARTFESVARAWLADREKRVRDEKLAPSTYSQYKIMVDRHIIPPEGPLRLRDVADIKPADIRKALEPRKYLVTVLDIAQAQEEGKRYRSFGSIPKRRAVLHSIFQYAVRHEFITVNPVASVERERKTVREKRPQVGLTRKQFDALFAAAQGTPGELYVTLALATGARPSELLALQWQDIDLTAKRITISASLGQVEIDGDRVRKAIKTGESGVRVVDIESPIVKVLKKHVGAPTDFVFASRSGKPMNLRNVAKRWVGPLAEEIGVTRLTPYTLRHAVATEFARARVPDKIAADLLGHASTRMLKSVYQHAEADDKRAAAKALANRFKTRAPRKKKSRT